ncbi:MAG: class I SAM-dependent methyltransferase [Pseudomonadales bacterium]
MSRLKRFVSGIGFKSSNYWEQRYADGRDSGSGSEGRLAEYKAEFLNKFVESNDIESVVEFGCGDGRQLSYANYKKYTGLDVSESALQLCREKYREDSSKRFVLADSFVENLKSDSDRADLVLSLDVIYHLVEDAVFEKYIADIFATAKNWVIIYSSNYDAKQEKAHVLHRKFTDHIAGIIGGWSLHEHLRNKYAFEKDDSQSTSHADFFVYRRA